MTAANRFLQAALKQAQMAAKKNEVPVGAVVVYKDKIIARAHNLRETKQQTASHAEMIAIAKACKKLGSWRLVDCDLYVTLEPCLMCAATLYQARIRTVYFGAIDQKAGVLSLGFSIHNNPRLNHRYKLEHCELPECGKILTDFFKHRRGQKKHRA